MTKKVNIGREVILSEAEMKLKKKEVQLKLRKLKTGKKLILSEAGKRHKKDVKRIERSIASAPDKRKYIELEKTILRNILHKEINITNDCTLVKVAGQLTRYYRTGQYEWPLDQIALIRQHYNNYLRGIINYNEDALTPKAETIVDAIRLYQLEVYLNKPKAAPERTTLQYTDLWKKPEHGTKVKELFESAGITVKGVHSPNLTKCKNPDTELLRAFETLEQLMIYRHRTPAVKCFYKEFHAPVNVSDKTLSSRPDNLGSVEHKRFTKLFDSLLR